jgi:hypothetical protein
MNNFCRGCTKPSDDEQQEMANDMIINLVSEQKEESEEENEICTEVVKKCHRRKV